MYSQNSTSILLLSFYSNVKVQTHRVVQSVTTTGVTSSLFCFKDFANEVASTFLFCSFHPLRLIFLSVTPFSPLAVILSKGKKRKVEKNEMKNSSLFSLTPSPTTLTESLLRVCTNNKTVFGGQDEGGRGEQREEKERMRQKTVGKK